MADGFGGKPLPFFKNFYAGGISSVRGYRHQFAWPEGCRRQFAGWHQRLVGIGGIAVPFPGLENDKSVRLGVFVDGGIGIWPG